jgi:CheY-like chemotaxis protein
MRWCAQAPPVPSAARELSPDVILLDYAMLDIDGAEISRWLRADPTTAAIPIILMSTHPPAA